MASPTAIPHPETSSHHRADSNTELSGDGSFRFRPSYSPPTSIYSRATGAFSMPGGNPSSLRMPMGLSMGPSSPTNRFPAVGGRSPDNAAAAHNRTRSQTTTGAPTKETFDERLPMPKPPTFTSAAPIASSAGSSYISAGDLSRSPTSPNLVSPNSASGAAANSFQPGYALGRVSSIPLGSSYEQTQKRLNSNSWGQKGGWNMGSLRSPSFSGRGADEGGGTTAGGAMGGLLRRLSIGGGGHRPPAEHRYSIGSTADFNNTVGVQEQPRSSSPPMPMGHAPRDSGVGFSNEAGGSPKQMSSTRGRQGSISGSGKRKPSPMGERLLMGHFNAH